MAIGAAGPSLEGDPPRQQNFRTGSGIEAWKRAFRPRGGVRRGRERSVGMRFVLGTVGATGALLLACALEPELSWDELQRQTACAARRSGTAPFYVLAIASTPAGSDRLVAVTENFVPTRWEGPLPRLPEDFEVSYTEAQLAEVRDRVGSLATNALVRGLAGHGFLHRIYERRGDDHDAYRDALAQVLLERGRFPSRGDLVARLQLGRLPCTEVARLERRAPSPGFVAPSGPRWGAEWPYFLQAPLLALSGTRVECAWRDGIVSQRYCYLADSIGPFLRSEGERIPHGDYVVTIPWAAPMTGAELAAHLRDFPENRKLAETRALLRPPRGRELSSIHGRFSRGEEDGLWEWFAANGEVLFRVRYRRGRVISCAGERPAPNEWSGRSIADAAEEPADCASARASSLKAGAGQRP
jgi:hypothetical protein